MRTQTEHYINLPGDITIGLTSTGDVPVGKREELLLGAYLPGGQLLQETPVHVDATIHHEESETRGLWQDGPDVVVRDTWQNDFAADIPYLLYGVARHLWLAKGIYPTHAAATKHANNLSVLAGHSGAGKTSTAMRLLRDHNQRLFSGNTTLLAFDETDTLHAIAGTQTVTLRTQDFLQSGLRATEHTTYGDRTAFRLPPEHYAPRAVTRVGSIALIRLNDTAPHWERLSPLSALHDFYPYALDTVRSAVIGATGHGVHVGEVKAETYRNLAAQLAHSLGSVAAFRGTGSGSFIAEQVARL